MSSLINSRMLILLALLIMAQKTSIAQLARQECEVLSVSVTVPIVPDTSKSKLVWKPFGAGTILKQTGNGILYGAGLGVGGLLVGGVIGVTALKSRNKDDYRGLAIALGGGVAGVVIGTSWGIYNAGESDGGNGTVIGMILGTAAVAAIPTLFVTGSSPSVRAKSISYGLAPFLIFLGPILGYHISATPVYSSQIPDVHAELEITPLFGQGCTGIQLSVTF